MNRGNDLRMREPSILRRVTLGRLVALNAAGQEEPQSKQLALMMQLGFQLGGQHGLSSNLATWGKKEDKTQRSGPVPYAPRLKGPTTNPVLLHLFDIASFNVATCVKMCVYLTPLIAILDITHKHS